MVGTVFCHIIIQEEQREAFKLIIFLETDLKVDFVDRLIKSINV